MDKLIRSRDHYKNYEYDFDTEFKNGEWESSLESYNDDISPICVYHKHNVSAIKKMKKLIRGYIDESKGLELHKKHYSVYYDYPDDILKNAKAGFAYNIADHDCFEGILKYGFIPNAKTDEEVYEGSLLIDKYKPDYVREFYRSASNYSYFNFENYNFSRDRKDVDLWAMDLSNLNKNKFRISSQGIAGFVNCYFSYKYEEDEEFKKSVGYEKHVKEQKKLALQMAKLYWKHSYTWDEYMKDIHLSSTKQWCMDELLYCGFIPPENIKHIGTWNSEGIFTIVNGFEKCINENIYDYKKIIEEYQAHWVE